MAQHGIVEGEQLPRGAHRRHQHHGSRRLELIGCTYQFEAVFPGDFPGDFRRYSIQYDIHNHRYLQKTWPHPKIHYSIVFHITMPFRFVNSQNFRRTACRNTSGFRPAARLNLASKNRTVIPAKRRLHKIPKHHTTETRRPVRETFRQRIDLAGLLTDPCPEAFPPRGAVAEIFGTSRGFTAAGLSGIYTRFPFHTLPRRGAENQI